MLATGHTNHAFQRFVKRLWPLASIYFWPFASMPTGMPNDFPSRSLDKIVVRLPDGMRDRLAAEAKANGRSMNAEIVARLEMTLETQVTSKERLHELLRWIAGVSAQDAVESLSRRLGLTPVSEEDIERDPEAEARRAARARDFFLTMPEAAGDPTEMLPAGKRRKPRN